MCNKQMFFNGMAELLTLILLCVLSNRTPSLLYPDGHRPSCVVTLEILTENALIYCGLVSAEDIMSQLLN